MNPPHAPGFPSVPTGCSDRVILHSDLNAFYASVEQLLSPSLRGKAMAVCGDPEARHGIVLAKSEPARLAGIRTGMTVWQARRLCPGLICVPPRFRTYVQFSELVRNIYGRYTDLIEPFGLDECWLDVSGSVRLFGPGYAIAQQIRRQVRQELGLTVSVGISFNKVFAKLGSDLHKPDGQTLITRDNFRRIVWPLPVDALLFVGQSTGEKLRRIGISTIGALAQMPSGTALQLLGKGGLQLRDYALGMDTAPVVPAAEFPAAKSISRGVTASADLLTPQEVLSVIAQLTQEVVHVMYRTGVYAAGGAISVRHPDLSSRDCQCRLPLSTRNPRTIAATLGELYLQKCGILPVRAITVRVYDLRTSRAGEQTSLFDCPEEESRMERLDSAVDAIRTRFGVQSLLPATVLTNTKTAEGHRCEKHSAVTTLHGNYSE